VLAPLPYNRHMDIGIEVQGVRKSFGPTLALDGMTFTVRPGQVTGFVGPNGAGKTTTMRVILGLDAPDGGSAVVAGQPYNTLRRPLTHLGSLLDAGALQPSRTARNHLLWLARSQGLATDRVDAVLAQAGLDKAARRRAGGFSLGMRQRLGLAAAMLGDPATLMMDEPFNGMDPEGIVWMRTFLRSLAAAGRAVLVSSHLMSELEDTADHLVIVGRGKVIADTSVAGLLAAASGDRALLRTTEPDGDGAGARGGLRHHCQRRPADRHRPGHRADRVAARPAGGPVLRAVRAPRHPGGGLPGADPGRGRVPGSACGGFRATGVWAVGVRGYPPGKHCPGERSVPPG
jgi:ABC-2 type transport system ATP-binding protein